MPKNCKYWPTMNKVIQKAKLLVWRFDQNINYIKTKCNHKVEMKFFRLFWVLLLLGRQIYKLELSKRWKILNIFRVSFIRLVNITKKRVDKIAGKLKFDAGNQTYKLNEIQKIAVHIRKSKTGYVPGFYYIIFWQS